MIHELISREKNILQTLPENLKSDLICAADGPIPQRTAFQSKNKLDVDMHLQRFRWYALNMGVAYLFHVELNLFQILLDLSLQLHIIDGMVKIWTFHETL